MKSVLKSTTSLVLAMSLALPHVAYAQGEADPAAEQLEQQLRADQQAQAEANAEADAKAEAKAERKAERQAERKEERQAERKAERQAERKAERQAERAEQAQQQAEQPVQQQAESTAPAPTVNSGEPVSEQQATQEQVQNPAPQATETTQPPAATATQEGLTAEERRAERRQERREERREQRRAERMEDVDAAPELDSNAQAAASQQLEAESQGAAAAGTGEGQVTTQTINEGDVRSSSEEFTTRANQVAPVAEEDDGLSTAQKVAILGLGALAVNQLLKNNDRVITNSGDRVVVQGDNGLRVIKDDDILLRRPGSEVRTEQFNDGSTRSYVNYSDGSQVVTVRAADGRVLRRTRVLANGQEVTLFDDTRAVEAVQVSQLPTYRGQSYDYNGSTNAEDLRLALQATQQNDIDRRFSLAQIRNIDAVRHLVPEIDLDNVTFETGSAVIRPEQAQELAGLGRAMASAIQDNPGNVFLIEGHTDAVGTAGLNLALSDRRAETVALALTEYFDVPPENMVVQGYGEADLKVATDRAERQNRRVSVRQITQLLN
ncbi:MAG: OmpA family protein [Pseudomonadota bacterium]|nr:OmpA family protein [Pseudomonadota bacterium]